MVRVTEEPIDPAMAYRLVDTKLSGSVVFHYAVVKRYTGRVRPTSHIDYTLKGDVVAEMEALAAELKEKWLLEDVLLLRRTGRILAGEIISLVAASSPNSADAFEASKYGTSKLKRLATLLKREAFCD